MLVWSVGFENKEFYYDLEDIVISVIAMKYARQYINDHRDKTKLKIEQNILKFSCPPVAE